nr:helix-turn-helix domain-containing protein [Nocardiopsis sp. HUAS JQ3]
MAETPRRGRGRPVDPATRARARELHAQGWKRNAIARELGMSGSTVSGIIHAAGKSFDRTATEAATEARVADTAATRAELAERRARLSAELLGDAEKLRALLWQPFRHGEFGGKDNVWSEVSLPQPPVGAQRTILASVHQAIKDHIELERLDSDNGVADAAGVLGDILSGVRAAYAEQLAADQADTDNAPDGDTPAEPPGE